MIKKVLSFILLSFISSGLFAITVHIPNPYTRGEWKHYYNVMKIEYGINYIKFITEDGQRIISSKYIVEY